MRIAIVALLICLGLAAASCCLADQFKDVPDDHWAAEYVSAVKASGVMNGYPDGTFKGEQPVTRYELAAALVNMIDCIERGLKPEIKTEETSVQAPSPPAISDNNKPADKSDPATILKQGGFIAADSPLMKDFDKNVSSTELAEALSSVTKRLIEINIPAPKEHQP